MSEIIKKSKTIENAIELALEELGCEREDVEIEIIQEPVKGIFGLSKMAKVKVKTLYIDGNKEESKQADELLEEACSDDNKKIIIEGKDVIKQLLSHMAMQQIKITPSIDEDTVVFNINTESEGLLIGRQGQTLTALQYIVNRIMNNKNENRSRCIIDVGGYRIKHKIILEKTAKRIAKKVAETQVEEQLNAMNAYDRRIVHLTIKENPDVVTYSLGEGSFRRVVIAPKDKLQNQ